MVFVWTGNSRGKNLLATSQQALHLKQALGVMHSTHSHTTLGFSTSASCSGPAYSRKPNSFVGLGRKCSVENAHIHQSDCEQLIYSWDAGSILVRHSSSFLAFADVCLIICRLVECPIFNEPNHFGCYIGSLPSSTTLLKCSAHFLHAIDDGPNNVWYVASHTSCIHAEKPLYLSLMKPFHYSFLVLLRINGSECIEAFTEVFWGKCTNQIACVLCQVVAWEVED